MWSFQIDITTVPSEGRMPPQLDGAASITPLVSNALLRVTRRGCFAFSLRTAFSARAIGRSSCSTWSQNATTCASPRLSAFARSCVTSRSASRAIRSIVHRLLRERSTEEDCSMAGLFVIRRFGPGGPNISLEINPLTCGGMLGASLVQARQASRHDTFGPHFRESTLQEGKQARLQMASFQQQVDAGGSAL